MAKEVRLAAKMVYLRFGPMGVNPTELSNQRVFGVGFLVDFLVSELRVDDTAKFLVQVVFQKVQVSLLESLAPLLRELDPWRNGKCDEAKSRCETDQSLINGPST